MPANLSPQRRRWLEPLHTAVCPQCGAAVPVVGARWLSVHREGSAEYAYPRGSSQRCLGSLLPVSAPELW